MSKKLLASILFSIALFLGFGLVLSKYDQVEALKLALAEREVIYEARKKAFANVNNFEQETLRYQTDVSRMGIFLPEKQKNDEILSAIYSAGIESGIELGNVSLGTSQVIEGKKIAATPIAIEGFVSYQGLTRFLTSLESSLRIFDISELSVSNNAGGNGFLLNNGLTASIKLKVYHLQ